MSVSVGLAVQICTHTPTFVTAINGQHNRDP